MDLYLATLVVSLPVVFFVVYLLWHGISHIAAMIFLSRLGWHRRRPW